METCQNDARQRMGGVGSMRRVNSVPTPPRARELIASTSEYAGSAPLMSHFFMLKKKKNEFFCFLASLEDFCEG